MNEDEEVKDDQPIFSEEFHRLMFPQEEHYPIAEITVIGTEQKTRDVKLIPIRNILYDKGMIKKIKEICKPRIRNPKPTLKVMPHGFNLHKWVNVWADIKNERPLDPIIVKRHLRGGAEYYEVIDGRHRATASLCAGFDFVPAFVQN